jgi:hypothetical protein
MMVAALWRRSWKCVEANSLCFSESFEALAEGLEFCLWQLGGVPREHRTDNPSAAVQTIEPDRSRRWTDRYLSLMTHYGLTPTTNTPGEAHENGDVEQSHFRSSENAGPNYPPSIEGEPTTGVGGDMQNLGVLVGALLLVFVSSVALGIISQPFVALFSLSVLGLLIGAVVWTRRDDLHERPRERRQLHDEG